MSMRQRCVRDCVCCGATAKVLALRRPLWLLPPKRPAACAPSRTGVSPSLWQRVPRCGQRALPYFRGSRSSPPVLAALIQTIAGAPFPPATRAVSALAAAPRPATLGGRPAACRRVGWEPASWQCVSLPPWRRRSPHSRGPSGMGVSASVPQAQVPSGATLGPLGDDAIRFRRLSPLPSAVLRTLPAVRCGSALLAVPHLLYPDCNGCEVLSRCYSAPPRPAAAAPFWFGDA